jgi:hypothetical protein
MKKLFTTEFVASLQPQATRYEVFDKQLAGFAVRVSTNGRLVWYVQKRYTAADLTSKVHKEVLGDTTSMSLDDARAKALEVITGLQTIPKCLPAAVQPRITVATLYDTYRSERKLSERTAKELLYTRIRVQLLKDARVIAECPLSVDPDCMSSYKRIIKMLVDNKLIRAEKAKLFTVEECPEGREAMVFLNIKRDKIPVLIIAH